MKNLFMSLSIRVKFFFISIFILVISFTVMGYHEKITLTSIVQGEALEKAKSDLQTGFSIIDLKYPGEWQIKDGKLYKGDTLMNDNYEIVDIIGDLTNGNTVTIFLDDTRITTNVLVDGERAVGTKVSDVVKEKVLKQGEVYLGQANVVGHTYQSAYMPIKDSNEKIIGMWYVGAPDTSERIQKVILDETINIFVTAFIIIAIAILLNYLLTRPIINRIQTTVDLMQALANGEFNKRELKVESHDETGMLIQSVNKMMKELRAILLQVNDSSIQLASSSEELTASSEQTSKATEQITIAMQEVASGSEKQMSHFMNTNQMASSISRGMEQAFQSIQHMNDYSATANEKARVGTETITQTIEQMSLIQKTVKETAEVINNLGGKSEEISRIVEVIAQIVQQTNILSLNANIEAARAGEYGKGFAVVADEVRKLAEQSGEAAEEVRELIGQIQIEAHKAVESMNIGTEVVQEGIQQVYQSGHSFEDIVKSIAAISRQSEDGAHIIKEVNEISQEMVEIINKATIISQQSSANTQNIAVAAEEQNASVEEIASSVEVLGEMAEKLQLIVGKFKLK
ncbi:hypothetical protein BLL40_12200 [Domibacillus mangrovi]|uniref:Methyl-accepting chemotaxis protein n=1 Tax=Domibacillus mangrovi TaxID=1714354 RepID=A0A1Q5P1V4_9BACI|nr:hypothetical protein BLL40_12200 [Domibacillus mangrovi]